MCMYFFGSYILCIIKKKIFKDFLSSFLYVYLCMHTFVCLCNYTYTSVFICACVYTACTNLISEISSDIFLHILSLSLDKHNYLLSIFFINIYIFLLVLGSYFTTRKTLESH